MPIDGRNAIRSAKSANEWTANELLAYNIEVSHQEALEFFGKELNSIDYLDPNLLSVVDPASAVAAESGFSKDVYHFHTYLRLASRHDINQKSAMHDFARTLYEVMGFEEPGTILRSHYEIPFTICADYKIAQTDLCLNHLTTSMILLVAQQRMEDGYETAECQIIASAIAMFQHNNEWRIARGFEPLDSMIVPCVGLVGRRSTFYKVPVTTYLSECVITGEYPVEPTTVLRCAPPDPSQLSDGMEVSSYRQIALQYYAAFRDMARSCWTPFLQH